MGEIIRHRTLEVTVKDLILESASHSNILPIISTCNVKCRFCSHKQNFSSVESRSMPPISMDLLDEALALMNPGKPVFIGESVTRLMEGEPLVHPQIAEILQKIRKKLPGAEIRLTTNGNKLDQDMVNFLADLGSVVITLSLNSSSVVQREKLMNDSRAETAVASPALLQAAAIPYHGSIVAMPHLTGWEDLADTLAFFDRHGAATVRVFLPGYTRNASAELIYPSDLRSLLHHFITDIRPHLTIPVTLEPPMINDLKAEVAGVLAGSPAFLAGVKAGDIIVLVDEVPVRSRVDAFHKIVTGTNPVVEVIRQNHSLTLEIVKNKGQTSGLVLDYDIDPNLIREIAGAVKSKRSCRPVLFASELGFPSVKMGLENFYKEKSTIQIVKVKNKFFGGSIGCAGLLTVEDMLDTLGQYQTDTDLLVLPAIAFDARGRDITGRSYFELEVDDGPDVVLI